MMHPEHIRLAVKESLRGIGVQEHSLMKLIKLTFMAESNFELFWPDGQDIDEKNRYGFSRISEEEFRSFLYDYVTHHVLRTRIEEFFDVNLKTDPFDRLLRRLKYDLSFQIAITYGIYSSRYDVPPEDTIRGCAMYYHKHWLGSGYTEEDLQYLEEDYVDAFA